MQECSYKGEVRELPKTYDDKNCIYELTYAKGIDKMEQKYDGNEFTKPHTQTSPIKPFIL